MEIFPDDTVAVVIGQLTTLLAANVVVIIGVLGFGIAVAFVTRWFSKSTKKIKAH